MSTSLRSALRRETPLQIPGVINAYSALTVQRLGFRAAYISGSGVATASYGLPDLGVTSLADVLVDVGRITSACDLPVLVDCDTGWGAALGIERTVVQMERAGASGIHLEDQVEAKRCGHLEGKQLVETPEMCDRLKVAAATKSSAEFMIFARTDALAVEGLDATLDRCRSYVDSGADAIFAEAVTELWQYEKFAEASGVPILANITEFGKTPMWHVDELRDAGVSMVIYPLSAFRAMSKAAEDVYTALRDAGSQRAVLGQMETREALYRNIGYDVAQSKIDEMLSRRGKGDR